MALNWNVKDCKDWKDITNYKDSDDYKDILQWKITENLVWSAMRCGYTNITEDNYKEVWLKINLYERYLGNYIRILEDGTEDNYIPYYTTLEDVKRRIGLSTNCSNLTIEKVFKKLLSTIKDSGYIFVDHNARK